MKSSERWSLYTHQLPPLRVRDHVRIQNQTGSYPTKWDKTGQIVEVRQFDQYVIRMDGSGRQSLRNRRFLRKFIPVQQPAKRRSILQDLQQLPQVKTQPNPTLHLPHFSNQKMEMKLLQPLLPVSTSAPDPILPTCQLSLHSRSSRHLLVRHCYQVTTTQPIITPPV